MSPNARLVEQAMARLLRGESLRTDGKLNKSNLAKEAGLSRQALYRTRDAAGTPLTEVFARLVKDQAKQQPTDANLARITRLRQDLTDCQERRRALTSRLEQAQERDRALANVVQLLDSENGRLRQRLERAGSNVSRLHGDRRPS